MEDRTPDTPQEPTPNPSAGEPTPTQEGFRPGVDPEQAAREQDPPGGPLASLVGAAATEVEAELSDSPEAEAEAAQLGVEHEGIEASQIIGLTLATVLSIVFLVLAVYFIFYLPKLNTTRADAEAVPGDRYVELRENRAEAFDKISQYATSPDGGGVYQIPIEVAMSQIANEATDAPIDAPITRTDFNLSWISLHPAPAVAAGEAPSGGETVVPVDTPADAPTDADTPVEEPAPEPAPADAQE